MILFYYLLAALFPPSSRIRDLIKQIYPAIIVFKSGSYIFVANFRYVGQEEICVLYGTKGLYFCQFSTHYTTANFYSTYKSRTGQCMRKNIQDKYLLKVQCSASFNSAATL